MNSRSGPVEYEWRDFLILAHDLRSRRPRWQSWLTTSVAIMAALVVTSVWRQPPVIWLIVAIVAGLALWCAAVVSPYVFAQQMQFTYCRNPHRGAQYFDILPAQLEILSPHGTTQVNWSGFDTIRERDDCVLAYLSRRQAYLIPARAFGTPGEFRAFAGDIKSRWKEASA